MCGKGGKESQKYSPVITVFEKPGTFRWHATMLTEFILSNDKIFELQATGNGTKFIHKELFSGLMAVLMWGAFEKSVPSMLNSMNEALKKKAEMR
jgi:hypothetical protein